MNNPERVIFRTVKNPYINTQGYLACFPDDPANPGRIGCVSFYFLNDTAIFESYSEADMGYYYEQTRIVHKGTDTAKKLLQAIERYYDSEFKVVEKMKR